MKSIPVLLIIILFSFSLTFSQNENAIVINEDIQLIHLQDSIFVHVTWEDSEKFGRFSSNGLIIINKGEAVMIDTPMDNKKTQLLVKYIEKTFHAEVIKLIIGHYHEDCMGGIDYIHKRGIESIACLKTINKCKEFNLTIPRTSFKDSLNIDFKGLNIECKYLGGGHTEDNIVVFIPSKNILFGGCLIKSMNSKSLGNTADAVIDDWDRTVQKVIGACGKCETVIPGHGNFGGPELLRNTIRLVKEYKKKN